MADWVTIFSSVATAGGTLILAVATFSSVKSANRAARSAERSLLAGLRPVLIPSRDDDPPQRVRFGDGHSFSVDGHGAALDVGDNGALYIGLAVRNGGTGLAVIHGWRAGEYDTAREGAPPVEEFRRQQRDLYIPAGETGFWQGAIRDSSEQAYESVRGAIASGARLAVDVLYGDYEGGQRTIARFSLSTDGLPTAEPSGAEPQQSENGSYVFRAEVVRYYNVDGDAPR